MQVFVRDNNVDQAMRVLKKKMMREGIFRQVKAKTFFSKPSEMRARELTEAIRRSRKLARKKAERDGLLPKPKPKIKLLGVGRPLNLTMNALPLHPNKVTGT